MKRKSSKTAAVSHSQNSHEYTPNSNFKLENEFFDFSGKVMLVGDSGVGKTCLLVRFKDDTFLSGNYISTIGIDFRNKVIAVDGEKVKLQIWDTAGQERFHSITRAYYRDADALLLLFDVTNRHSFDNIRSWLTEIHEYSPDNIGIMILGNKADLLNERVVRKEDVERFAKDHCVPYLETSAKTGVNVDLAFLSIARDLKNRKKLHKTESSSVIQERNAYEHKEASCC